MNEPPLRLAAEAPASETLEASRNFETFYDAEGRTLFRRLWLVTGNRSEVEELPEGANQFGSGYLEQRLTSVGVELLRSRFLSTGLFEHNLQLRSRSFHPGLTMAVRKGDRMVVVSASHFPSWRADVTKETPLRPERSCGSTHSLPIRRHGCRPQRGQTVRSVPT